VVTGKVDVRDAAARLPDEVGVDEAVEETLLTQEDSGDGAFEVAEAVE
jgi:hypothetical protein